MTEPLADQPAHLPVSEGRVLAHGHVFDLVTETFEFDGQTLTREFVEHPGAVGVLAVDEHDRLALIRQYRHPVRSRLWELPAGLLDVPGEDPQAAAQRELAEEVELRADHWEHLIDCYTTPGGSNELLRLYRAEGLHSTEHFARDGEEVELELVWRPFAEVLEAVRSSRVRNPTLVIGVLAEAARRA
ncbi:NUDIX domain-containing protein [Pseudoclavibacter soli]|uniref:NUDIX domain-containing protein n=1 Tax=Pseudoclavibacter soli TaxID=452623 RepID=UPI0004183254|nr:NUDIX hydrolase [Pseudoclavibacter soli]